MIDRFKNYCKKLETLSDAELDRSAEKLVRNENLSVAKLIAHLAQMSGRKTALKLGYSSIYDCAIRRLNLSEGAVPARVHVANVCRRFPQLLAARMAEVLEKALDAVLDKKDPKKKLERRQKKGLARPRSRSNEMTRHVPAAVVERVHARGQHQCEYRAADGKRCPARVVQVDHMRPFARFPNHNEHAMRLLCRAHNLLEAERVYGKAFIQKKIQQRRNGLETTNRRGAVF